MDKAKSRGILIPDFKIEFGKTKEGLIQIDEPPTHDSARFWSEKHYVIGKYQESHALDKEFLRQYLIKIGFTGEGDSPLLPSLVVEEISKRCIGSSNVLRGKRRLDDLQLKSVDQIIFDLDLE
jgi:phosphoribosylaminoimidazole-succinocarboxamide synthase